MKVVVAKSFFARAKGLMFKKDFDGVMVFVFSKPVNLSFHTFFMRFPIDIYFFLDKKLVYEKINVKPWKIIKPNTNYNLVAEVKHGTFNKKEILRLMHSF